MSPPTIGHLFAERRNGFDALRLFGAVLVLVSHSWVLTGQSESEPFAILLGHYIDGGGLAVAMFFVLSGFLIARSATIHPTLRYFEARARRIYPAFVVVLLVQTLILGPAMSPLSARAYLTDPATWSALARGLAFSPARGLPALFDANPVPGAVNGSLWTLRIEVICYIATWALASLLNPRRVWLIVGGACVLLCAAMLSPAALFSIVLPWPRLTPIVDCLVDFAAGAALYVWRDRVPHCASWAVAGVVLLVAAHGTVLAPALFHLVLPYLVLYVGLARSMAWLSVRRIGDISYGTYLYAFPIQQTAVALLGPGIGPVALAAIALPPTLLCAVLSRRFVEVPALRARPGVSRAAAGPVTGRPSA